MRVRALLTMLLPACFLLQAFCIATAAASDALSGPHVFGWGLSLPISDSSDGTHVWVANFGGNSVTELDAATGALVRVIMGPQYGFNGAIAVSSDGTHVWVANRAGGTTHQGSVTELDAATGALVRVIRGAQYGFNMPYAVSSDGTHVWVANFANGGTATEGASVTELRTATGALVQVITGPSYGFSGPDPEEHT